MWEGQGSTNRGEEGWTEDNRKSGERDGGSEGRGSITRNGGREEMEERRENAKGRLSCSP